MKKLLTMAAVLLVMSFAFFGCSDRVFDGTLPDSLNKGGFLTGGGGGGGGETGPKYEKGTVITRTFEVEITLDARGSSAAENTVFIQTPEDKKLGAPKVTFTKFDIKVDGGAAVDKKGDYTVGENAYGEGFQALIEWATAKLTVGQKVAFDLEFSIDRDLTEHMEFGLVDNSADPYWQKLCDSLQITNDKDFE